MTKCRPIPSCGLGIGLRSPHVSEIAATRPELAFLEVHAENYMAETPGLDRLLALRRDYPVSLHGVVLSLGSAEELDRGHLGRFEALIERIEPMLISEHLAWTAIGGAYLNDLRPLPYTEASLDLFCRHVEEAQEALGQRLLIENPSAYFRYRRSPIPEAEVITEASSRTGCGILCDVNNIHVSAWNFRFDPIAYLLALPIEAIGEIHLARHHAAEDVDILIDDRLQGRATCLGALRRGAPALGPVPTPIEWDNNLPALEVLLDEAHHAEELTHVHRYFNAA